MSVTVCLPASDGTAVERAVAGRLDVFGPRVELAGTRAFLWDPWVIRGGGDEFGFWPVLGHDCWRDRLAYSDDYMFHPDALIRHVGGRDAFVDAVTWPKAGAGALLTLDGWWVEGDGEAYHGECANSSCPHGPHPYAQSALRIGAHAAKAGYLRELPGDVVLVQVHGHC